MFNKHSCPKTIMLWWDAPTGSLIFYTAEDPDLFDKPNLGYICLEQSIKEAVAWFLRGRPSGSLQGTFIAELVFDYSLNTFRKMRRAYLWLCRRDTEKSMMAAVFEAIRRLRQIKETLYC